jgi:hypothetical protein
MRAVGLMLKAGAMGPISVIAALRSVSYADAEAEANRVQTDSGLSRAEALAAIYTTRAAKAVQEAAE